MGDPGPHVPAGTGHGRPIVYPRRDVVDAIRYLDRGGVPARSCEADVEERGQLALVGGHQRGQSAAGGDRIAVTMTAVRLRRSRMLAAL